MSGRVFGFLLVRSLMVFLLDFGKFIAILFKTLVVGSKRLFDWSYLHMTTIHSANNSCLNSAIWVAVYTETLLKLGRSGVPNSESLFEDTRSNHRVGHRCSHGDRCLSKCCVS